LNRAKEVLSGGRNIPSLGDDGMLGIKESEVEIPSSNNWSHFQSLGLEL